MGKNKESPKPLLREHATVSEQWTSLSKTNIRQTLCFRKMFCGKIRLKFDHFKIGTL